MGDKETNVLNKRLIFNQFFNYFCLALSVFALLPLFLIIFGVLQNGIGRINLSFFLENQPSPSNSGGGILNALLGTFYIVSLATIISTPLSILAGFYLSENRKKRFTELLYSMFNILQSIPAIVIGIVVYAWVVRPMGNFSLLSGSAALAVMMFPYISIAATEMFSLVPNNLKEAGYALGAPRYRLFFKLLLPTSLKGILTGILLSISRVAGESAPLLFTAFGNPYVNFNLNEPTSSLPVLIFQYAISPYKNWQDVAWGASLVLIISIIFLNIMSRYLLKVKKN